MQHQDDCEQSHSKLDVTRTGPDGPKLDPARSALQTMSEAIVQV